jgi:hypothetical protein
MLAKMGDVHRRAVIMAAAAVVAVLGTMSILADGTLGDNLRGGSGDIRPSGIEYTYDGPPVAASIRENVLGSVIEAGPRQGLRRVERSGAGPTDRRPGEARPGQLDDGGQVDDGGSGGGGGTGPGSTVKDTVNTVTDDVRETAGGVTDTLDETVNAITDTAGAGNEVDEVVDDTTDTFDGVTETVVDVVGDTGGVVDGVTDELLP